MMKKWLLLCVSLVLPLVTITAQEGTCGLETQFEVGDMGWVTPGLPNNVRAEPSRNARLVGEIPGGSTFTVLEIGGCSDGFIWLKIKFDDGDGWTAEADAEDYFVEPLDGEIIQAGNVWFILPSELEGVEIEAEFGPETEPEDQWDVVPYAGFTFENYLDEEVFRPITLEIFRPEDFEGQEDERFADYVVGTANLLATFIEEKPDLSEVYDVMNFSLGAVCPYNVFLDTLDFAGGSGYRFMNSCTQDRMIGYQTISYKYRGLTFDGEYLVLAEFQISAPEMPPQFEDGNYASEDEYVDALIEYYESVDPDDYTPTIETFDKLIASIRIEED